MNARNYFNGLTLLFLSSLLFTAPLSPAYAHEKGENYVWLNVSSNQLGGRIELDLKDIKSRLDIDWEKHGATPDEAIKATAPQVQNYLRQHYFIVTDQTNKIEFTEAKYFEEYGKYAQYYYRVPMAQIPDTFIVRNDIFVTREDPLHRSLLVFEYNELKGEEYDHRSAITIFGPHAKERVINLNNVPALIKPKEFIREGIFHLAIGIDHILFLLALLLMTVMVVRGPKDIVPVPTFKKAFWNVLKVVTLFTIAHSITLSLAALDVVRLPARVVESIIALSIVIVGVNNMFPRFNHKSWLLIFLFGLFHGMGFASVMADLPFRMKDLLKVIIAFNIGVEMGQIAIVVVLFPLLYALRKTSFYRPVILVGGSALISIIALYWLVQRAFDL